MAGDNAGGRWVGTDLLGGSCVREREEMRDGMGWSFADRKQREALAEGGQVRPELISCARQQDVTPRKYRQRRDSLC